MALRSISDLAEELQLPNEQVERYGNDRAKIDMEVATTRPLAGKLILVSAITPTPSGEGKTTTSISLAQGMKHQGHRVALALREPSMGPVFGRKGGATGGGKSTVVPSDRINLHFNGDFHAITAAHNLISACIDNQLHFRQSRLDPGRILWKRVMDGNDRSLRSILVGLQGNGVARESGFDITAASEIMAILCFAETMEDLRQRIDAILLGFDSKWDPVYARELKITGAIMALLRDAMKPNLVQSLEGVPAIIHGGPFANIAHGCNSVLATKTALGGADYVVTEAGFAFDLGGEKFFDIKCRIAGLDPAAIVLVATIRALKMHGGKALKEITDPDPGAVEAGLENLEAHIEGASHFQRPIVVAVNRFSTDAPDEIRVVESFCREKGITCVHSDGYASGGPGAADFADAVVEAASQTSPALEFLYPSNAESIPDKIEAVARKLYGADGVRLSSVAEKRLKRIQKLGLSHLPVCIAKTQDSLSDDPTKLGRPKGFQITVRDFEIASGAGFIIALTGDLLRMPALPKIPAAESVDVDADRHISGLMAG